MTFTIFKKTGEIYFDPENGIMDEGDDMDIEVPTHRVHRDIAEMLYMEHKGKLRDEVMLPEVREQVIALIETLCSEYSLWETLEKEFYSELTDKYEAECNDD